jgi:hypothetical protein
LGRLDQRVPRDPPGAKVGLGKGSGDAHDDGGESARQRIADVWRSSLRES